MFKFLRKYNKWILAVGGTLLLITFLIPFAFTELGNMQARTGATWATVTRPERRNITNGDLELIHRELRLLNTLQQFQGRLLPVDALDSPQHWYLLVAEAEDAGLVGGAARLAQTQGIQQLAQATGESLSFVSQTLAKVDGVMRMLDLYLDTQKISDRRLKSAARKLFHGVTAEVVVLEGSEPDPPATFTEAELTEQMDKYAELEPGEGEMGFGYRLPDRVKLEWLEIPSDRVREAIASSDRLNEVALRRHWRLNTATFGTPDPNAAVPDEVREHLLEQLLAETLDEIARYANDQLRVHRRGLEQKDGYYTLPEGWTDLALEDLALEVQQEFSVPLPVYHAEGDRWFTPDDTAELAGIGTAASDKFGPTPVAFPELIAAVRSFGSGRTIPVQAGVAGTPLRGEDGSVYLFNVTEADPSRPPASLDEVRDQVVADLERKAHFEQLAVRAEALRREAIDKGMLNMAMAHGTSVRRAGNIAMADLAKLLGAGALNATSVTPTALPVIGVNEPAVEAIVERSMALDASVPVSEIPEEERTFVVPVEDQLAVLVVRIVGHSPLTAETFATYASMGIAQRPLLAEEIGDNSEMTEVFSYDALAARHGFQLAAGSGGEDEDGTGSDA